MDHFFARIELDCKTTVIGSYATSPKDARAYDSVVRTKAAMWGSKCRRTKFNFPLQEVVILARPPAVLDHPPLGLES